MILSLMRKHAQSWLIKTLIAIIAVVFVFYFGYSFTARRALKTAYVNGDLITTDEYHKAYDNMVESLRHQYKGMWNDDMVKALDLKNQALTTLINQRLINQEARRLGLDVTEKEIQQAIQEYSVFQVNGRFDIGRYRAMLSRSRMKPEDFEASISQDLLGMKLRQFLYAFSEITDQELLDQYTFNNEKIKISLIQFKSETFKKAISPDEASIKEFFEKNKEKYRVPEKTKIAYLEIDPKSYEQGIKITDDEIKNYYEDNISTFKEPKKVEDVKEARAKPLEEVRGEIIGHLIRNASQDLAYEKGQTLLDQMPYDAELSQYAAGQGLEAKFTGYLSHDEPIPGIPGDRKLQQGIFSLGKNEASELLELGGKYYIFQVADRKASYLPELAEAAERVKADLIDDLAAKEAKTSAEDLLAELQKGKSWDDLAKERHLEIEKTDFFSRQSATPKIGYEPELQGKLFNLNEGKRYPDTVFENNKGSFVIRWEEYKGIDEAKFQEQEEKEKQRLSLMQKKHNRLFENWLDYLRAHADINIITPP